MLGENNNDEEEEEEEEEVCCFLISGQSEKHRTDIRIKVHMFPSLTTV